ncbi:MAG: hypothetical protein QOF08_2790 [Gaiellales bacterium]|nr:hypothetical protein [Gaiellales bacterium]
MSDGQSPEIDALRHDIARLTGRIYALEQVVERLVALPYADPLVAPPPVTAPPVTATQPPDPAFASTPIPPLPPRPVVPRPQPRMMAPAKPPRPPIEWGKLVEQLFTARTLAWAGGVATALGVVLLFVMAASRGWVTAPMRVGLGTFVSLVMLGVALELDRRKWRADAILSAAGVGIAGLYATLWAAASLYDFVSAVPASALAAVIAALAVAVAIRLRQEPLAVFGIAAAMLAPVLVSQEITAYGVLYSSLMLAAAMPLYARFGWRLLVSAAWLVGFGEAIGLLVHSRNDTGFGAPVVAIMVITVLFVGLLYLIELMPAERARVSSLGWAVASSSFTLSLGGVALYADTRHVHGHSLAGFALVGLTVAWALCAALPPALRRSHPDLTDVLAAFSLTVAAAATGMLVGGSALACTWAAQSAMLVAAAERIGRRSGLRQRRITIAAGVYLTLATISGILIVVPTDAHLHRLGDGSWRGSVALGVITLAGVAYCYGTRWVGHRVRVAAWALPALALGYLPLWALPAEWSVVALSALAATLLWYRRSPWIVGWLDDMAAIAIGSGWWLAAAAAALASAAPLDALTESEWTGVGERHGLIALAALTVAAGVAAWSLRRPRRDGLEYLLILPVATFAYLIAEALQPPYTMWAWLATAATLAAAVHSPALRRRLVAEPLLVASAGTLALGVVAAWNHDSSLRAVSNHGAIHGWPSIAIACGAAIVLASALLEPVRRSYALWLPYLLAAQLAAMLLPGQYPLVAIAALSAAVSITAITWPAVLRSRLTRLVMAEMAALSSVAIAALILIVYETPRMLFVSSNTPASGLAAAVAACCALFLAAAAARTRPGGAVWAIGRLRIAAALVYLAGAASLWTLAAAILGAEQLVARRELASSVHDHFQQGHVAVSISWVLVGLGLVIASLRGDRRSVRIGGIALLFVALAKLFLYDLAFLTAMARAVSFITTGSVLLVAALLLQRFAPQVKAALTEEPPEATPE